MKPVVFGIFMTLLVGAGLAWLWHSEQTPPPPPAPVADQETSQPPAAKEVHPVIRDLPSTSALPDAESAAAQPAGNIPTLVEAPAELDQSDQQVLAAVKDLSTLAVQWLTPKEQLRKWVLLVDNMAMGKVPVKNRPLSVAIAPFAVTGSEAEPVLAQSNYARTGPLVDAFVALDPELVAHYYRAWSPLLEEAYKELGQPGAFHDRMLAAIDRVLSVRPLATETIKLKQPAVYYRYADPEKEAATDVEKLMWRMGPRNTVRIQSQLREIKLALTTP